MFNRNTSPGWENMLKKLMRVAVENQQQLKIVTASLQTALNKLSCSEVVPDALPENFKLPFSTLQDLDHAEELLNDSLLQSQIVSICLQLRLLPIRVVFVFLHCHLSQTKIFCFIVYPISSVHSRRNN